MKRRSSDRPYDSGNSKVQAKLSRFFQAKDNANNISRKDDEAKSSLITSKSIQVAVPFSIDLLGDTAGSCHHEDPASSSICSATADQTIFNTILEARCSNVKLTPLEKQICDLKVAHPDLLLVCECGYKYQCFGEDAEQAGRILNMVVYPKHHLLGLSFPVHRLNVHVKKLVEAGCKVGVVRQAETRALKAVSDSKSGPFQRQLEAVYTKATFLDFSDDDLISKLPDASSNYNLDAVPLCMVFLTEPFSRSDGSEAQIGLLAVFTQSGCVVYDHFQDNSSRSKLDARLTHWQPAEIVLPDRAISAQTLNYVKMFTSYKSASGESIRLEFSSVSCEMEDDGELRDLPPVIRTCLAMADRYLSQYNMERFVRNAQNLQSYSEEGEVLQLDGQCVRNLSLVPSKGAGSFDGTVFSAINRTKTKLGSRLLRSWLLKPLARLEHILARHDAVEWFLNHRKDEAILAFKKALRALPDLDGRAAAVVHGRSRPRELIALCRSWMRFSDTCQQFRSYFTEDQFCPAVAAWVDVIVDSLEGVQDLLAQLDESASKDEDKSRLFRRLSDYPEMEKLIQKIHLVENQLEALKPSICRTLGLLRFNYVTVSGEDYLIQVQATKAGKFPHVPSSWIKISATKQSARFRSPEVTELYGELSRARERLKQAADEAWVQFQRRMAESYPILKRANAAIATMDVLSALADLAESENYVRPTMVDRSGLVEVVQGRHPVVSRLVQQRGGTASSYVPNDTRLDGSERGCMILTGPNMGGKSCYLSQVALIVVLAQMGSFVPADEARLSIFHSIYIRMGLHDEVYAGRSTFAVEMSETASILSGASLNSLVVIDELGRGTGTHDGTAIAYAVLDYLVNQIKCVTLFVTHYPAVVQLADLYPDRISSHHMGYLLDEDTEGESQLVLLYSLTAGQCPSSFGLNVARLAGVPPDVIDNAKKKSEAFRRSFESHQDQVEEFRRMFLTNQD